ncbi:MAG TPA: methyl-accepting chemotaxis protein, partial [Ktedonobacterales bacterium]|nr:methyl-accepting chemotaxis protein [Ktedonobacterales bacterium]
MMNRGSRPASASDLEHRAQQIKEVVRASAALRADMPPEAICALVAQTIHSTLGFRAAVVNLIIPGNRFFAIVATAGISDAERQRLLNDPPPVDHILSLMRPDFQVSRTRSYFIGHEHKYLLEGAGGITLLTPSAVAPPRSPNAWHPDDVFFVPLISVRENRLLGIISLDLPEDGKIPSFDTVEVIELLANQAATALDTARLFQERDHERQALQQGLEELLTHLDRMRQRDLSSRAHLRTSALTHVAGALNDVSETLGNVLADVREAGMVVQQQASEMRNAALQLVSGAQQQAEQIQTASQTIQRTSEQMRQIVTKAAASRAIAEEAN